MKLIGCILICVLLVIVFSKNVLATRTAKLEFSNNVARNNDTASSYKSTSCYYSTSMNPDILFKCENKQDMMHEAGSRTFGHKRIQFMLMPMLYKMGVMMTMLMVLTAISVKGLFVSLILLVLKFSTFLSKFHSGWHQHGPAHSWYPPQPIHLHVHGGFPYAHAHPYHGLESMSGPENEDHYYYRG